MRRKYPKNRKKKIPHEQYMEYDKVVRRGQPIDFYIMIYDGENWWACTEKPGSVFVDNYTAVGIVPAFRGCNYQVVLGYIAAITISNMRPYKYKFVFVKEAFNTAIAIQNVISRHYPNRNSTKVGRPITKK